MVRDVRVPPSAAVVGAFMALLAADVLAGGVQAKIFAAVLLGVVLAIWVARLARSWTRLVAAMLLVVLLIPNNGSYTLPEALPFQLEPYRVVIALLLIGWIVSLLVDPRVRTRATGFEKPLMVVIGATIGSELVNYHRVASLSSVVIKALWLFACFLLFVYMVVSIVRTRAALERIITVLVSSTCVVAVAAIVQRRSGYNVFDHLHTLLPVFDYNSAATALIEERGGNLRAFASSGHPIELSTLMAMVFPFAVYLAVSRRQRAWWLTVPLLLLGLFSANARTGIIGLIVVFVVFLWLRPRETFRCWPALIPFLLVLHVAAPGAIGGVIEGFFPKGGVVAQQSETFIGPHGKIEYETRLSRLGPSFKEFSEHNPLVGVGYGTRVTGKSSVPDNAIILDNEWLDTLLETGLLGVFGWIWLFALPIRRLGARAKIERDAQGWLAVAMAASLANFATAIFFYDAFGFIQATFVAFTILALAGVLLHIPARAASREGATERTARARRPPVALATD